MVGNQWSITKSSSGPESSITKFELNLISSFLVNVQKLIDQWEARKRLYFNPISLSANVQILFNKSQVKNSVEQDQKLTMPGEAYNEFTHQIWAQSNQWFVCKCIETTPQSENRRKQGDSGRAWPKIHQAWMFHNDPLNLSSIGSAVCLQIHINCLTNQRPGNGWNSAGQDKKLIRPGGSHNDFKHQIWNSFD